MSEPQVPPVSSLVAGKYEVMGLIGRGGMGSVWEGRHTSLGTRVAIKFIDQEYADSKEAQSRFVNEARAAATILSKHAIQIFDHGLTEDGRPYMVMELLVGEPLDKRIARLGRISLQETARILGQVCRALQRAHDAGIIHRDLKPENIFLVRSPDDDDEIAKVLDFGIAKIKTPDGGALTSSTKTGAVLGTPYYMSPEQARGLRSIDHRSDLWSLGIIAYKCITGVLPFEGESVGDLLVKICTAPVPRPSLTLPGLPQSFDAWFARTLDREPGNRFATATELADTLAFAAGVSVRRGVASSQPLMGGSGIQSSRGSLPITPYTPNVAPTISGAGLTAAPFVTAASVGVKTSRGGRVLWTILAVVLAAPLGAVLVWQLLPAKPASHASAPVTASAASSTIAPIASSSLVTLQSATATASTPEKLPPTSTAATRTNPRPWTAPKTAPSPATPPPVPTTAPPAATATTPPAATTAAPKPPAASTLVGAGY